MKKLAFILLLCCYQINIFAQNNNQNEGTLTIFADDGVRFWVSINGEKRNTKAAANVKIPTNNNSYWKAKIIFENQQLPEITKSVYTAAKGEVVYRVRKNRRGNYVVRLFSAPQDAGLALENDENTTQNNIPIRNNQEIKTNPQEDVVIALPNINTNVPTNNPFDNWNNNQNNNQNNNNQNNGNCQNPMNNTDFGRALQSMKSQSFENTKITVAKQFTKANCLSVEQIKMVIKEFGFESTKLEYAKFAYDYCYNKNNYYELNDAFSFSSSVQNLNQYLEGK